MSVESIATMYFDGGSRGNPGESAGAAVIAWDGEVVTVSNYIGHATNNEAEYAGLIVGLQKAVELGIQNIKIHGDSSLVVYQVNGLWKVKKPHLLPLRNTAKELMSKFIYRELTLIGRDNNKLADAAVNKCLDSGGING